MPLLSDKLGRVSSGASLPSTSFDTAAICTRTGMINKYTPTDAPAAERLPGDWYLLVGGVESRDEQVRGAL